MQKKLIALAVAGLASTAAFAQSNVTVYGVVDVYAVNGRADNAAGDQKLNGINSGGLSGSRLGFRGAEDLGNGLKAVFTYEFGTIDASANAATTTAGQPTTNGINSTRQSFVGLSGGFGTVVAGRLQHHAYDWAAKYDSMGGSIFSPMGQLSDNYGLATSSRDAAGRQDNTVAYVSPSFGGFTVKAAYSFGEQVKNNATVSEAQNIVQLGANYDNGPLSVGVVWTDLNNIGGTLAGGSEQERKEWALGGSYNFGMASVFASYQASNSDNFAGVAGNESDVKLYQVGGRIPVAGVGSVGLAYGQLKDERNNNVADQKAKSWSVDYQHNLSKRTTAYVGYTVINNDANTAYRLVNLQGSSAVAGVAQTVNTSADNNTSQLALGLRHSF